MKAAYIQGSYGQGDNNIFWMCPVIQDWNYITAKNIYFHFLWNNLFIGHSLFKAFICNILSIAEGRELLSESLKAVLKLSPCS